MGVGNRARLKCVSIPDRRDRFLETRVAGVFSVGREELWVDVRVFLFGPFRLDLDRYELAEEGRACALPRLVMELLSLLVRSGGRLVTRREIAGAIWPGTWDPDDATPSINTAINRIRQVLHDDPAQPRYLQTVIGKGYRFIAEVRFEESAGGAVPGATAAAEQDLVAEPAATGVASPISLDKLHAWYVAGAPVEVSALRIDDRTSVVAVRGSLRLGPGLKMLELQLTAEIDRGVRALVLDLAAVPVIDSAGLGLLLHVFGGMRERGGVLRLCHIADRVRELLRMTHTDTLLLLDADVAASLAALPRT